MSYTFTLQSVTCNTRSEAAINKVDEVWILVQTDGGEPTRIPSGPFSNFKMSDKSKDGDVNITINEDFTFENSAQITLYDMDSFIRIGSTDYIGTVRIAPDQASPQIATNGEQANYSVAFEFV